MQKTAFALLIHYLRNFIVPLVIIFIMMATDTVASQGAIFYITKMFDYAGKIDEVGTFRQMSGCLLMAAIIGITGVAAAYFSMRMSAKILPSIRSTVIKDAFDYVNQQPIAYFYDEMSGNISGKISLLHNSISDILQTIYNANFNFLFIFVNLIILISLNLYIGTAALIWIAGVTFIGTKLGKIRSENARQSGKKQSETNAVIVDAVANYSEIKSFANFKFERLHMLRYLRSFRKAETKERNTQALAGSCLHLVSTASSIGFDVLALFLFYKGQISSGEFIFICTIFMRFSSSAFAIMWIMNQISSSIGRINTALETLAVEPDIVDCPNALDYTASKISIAFENVDFGYRGKPKLFEKLNLEIKAGEKIGLVGASGSGKSTFIKLLSRFFDVNGGRITINGIDIREIKQESLHKLISTIPQDVCLFNRSLKDNIRYGNVTADDDMVIDAAKKAYADKFIEAFPAGYNTKVGERGVILSGGEKQRIAIARAIIKNAPILIFDEATSALDSESEKHIQASLSGLMNGKTVIAIAHRLSTLREMDRILVFDNGRIIEQGSHLSLLRKKGTYYKLYRIQNNGFIANE